MTVNSKAKDGILGEKPANGEKQANGARYIIPDSELGATKPLRIIIIGAGASGLNMARHLDLHMENVDFVVYEKNPDVGGTWYENRYPGCACDIPSHNYQFTWEPNPEWSTFYSHAPEIFRYFRSVAEKYDLLQYIKLQHRVSKAEWDEVSGNWIVSIEELESGRVFTETCDFLINGSGVLNHWKWPDLAGLHDFKGTLVHSANYPEGLDLKNKRVAVLGCGSSGVQIVPTIQPDVKSLVTFIRSPTWITAGYAPSKAGPNGSNFAFTEQQKEEFRANPKMYEEYRRDVERELNMRFKFILKDSKEQAEARRFSENEMKTKLGHDARLVKHLIPNFAVGCRRPTPGNGYLESLIKPNVRVVTDHIDRVTESGILLETGEVLEVDIFICATGFDLSYSPRFPLIGRDGLALGDYWKKKPEAYMSLAVDGFPNYFMFLGPNAPTGHGSVLPPIEHATKYMINVMKKAQTHMIKAIAPNKQCVREFNEHVTMYMERTAWTTPCRSWFKNGTVDGPVVATHPGSRIHWFHMLDEPRYEDYDITYEKSNRYAYLGNGFSRREHPELDSTYYMAEPQKGYKDY